MASEPPAMSSTNTDTRAEPISPPSSAFSGFLLPAFLWLVLLLAVLVWPFAAGLSNVGDPLIRNTIRLALLYYAVAVNLMLRLRPGDWSPSSRTVRLARSCWTLGWLAYLVHLAMAFHFYHHWSHADAVAHTEAVSGWGEGIYFSHLFTLAWGADVVSWWLRPRWYAIRPAWLGWTLHGYMAFIIFNGTVVYETGLIRWAGAVLFAELAAAWWRRAR